MRLQFEAISLDKQDLYLERLSRCSQIASDYSFINIWGWGPQYGLQWSWEDDLVWIKQAHPQAALWAPVGDWKTVDWERRLYPVLQSEQRMMRVPEGLLKILQETFTTPLGISETRGQWDYLYNRDDLAELKGNRFHKKKNLVNQFDKKYQSRYIPFGPEMIDKALAMQEDWCAWKDCESHETLAAENIAIERIITHWQAFKKATGGAICVDEHLVAYTIAEPMPDDSLVIHFEKGNPDYKGSYQAINQKFLAQMPKHYDLVNREQDLDDEGLRKAKLSYNPVDFVRKYEIRLKG